MKPSPGRQVFLYGTQTQLPHLSSGNRIQPPGSNLTSPSPPCVLPFWHLYGPRTAGEQSALDYSPAPNQTLLVLSRETVKTWHVQQIEPPRRDVYSICFIYIYIYIYKIQFL